MTSPKPAAAVDLEALKLDLAGYRDAITYGGQEQAIERLLEELLPDGLAAFIAELEQLRAGASKWIACADRMPPTGLNVLVANGLAFFVGIDWRTQTGFSSGNKIMWPVTHWMHQPPPYPSPPETVKP